MRRNFLAGRSLFGCPNRVNAAPASAATPPDQIKKQPLCQKSLVCNLSKRIRAIRQIRGQNSWHSTNSGQSQETRRRFSRKFARKSYPGECITREYRITILEVAKGLLPNHAE